MPDLYKVHKRGKPEMVSIKLTVAKNSPGYAALTKLAREQKTSVQRVIEVMVESYQPTESKSGKS